MEYRPQKSISPGWERASHREKQMRRRRTRSLTLCINTALPKQAPPGFGGIKIAFKGLHVRQLPVFAFPSRHLNICGISTDVHSVSKSLLLTPYWQRNKHSEAAKCDIKGGLQSGQLQLSLLLTRVSEGWLCHTSWQLTE